jgi:hypothetical protein
MTEDGRNIHYVAIGGSTPEYEQTVPSSAVKWVAQIAGHRKSIVITYMSRTSNTGKKEQRKMKQYLQPL